VDWAASSNGPRSRPPVQWAAPTVGGRRPSAPLLPHSQLRQDKIRYSARARQAPHPTHQQNVVSSRSPPLPYHSLPLSCLLGCLLRTYGGAHSLTFGSRLFRIGPHSACRHIGYRLLDLQRGARRPLRPCWFLLRHPLRHATSLRATDGRYGNGAATRERLPPVPAAVLEVSVSSCASGSAPSPGAAVRCGAGGCNRFCSCLTSKAPASQPASQAGRGAPFGTAPWYLLALADGGRTLRRSPTQGQLLQHEHPFGISGRTPVQIAKSTKKHLTRCGGTA
jgi:hypothetical protein